MCLTSSTEQKLNQQTVIFFWYITWDFDEYTKSYVIVFFLDSWDSFSSRWARRLPFNLSCVFFLWQLLEKPLFCWQRNTFIYFVSVEHKLISRPLGWNDFVKKKKKALFQKIWQQNISPPPSTVRGILFFRAKRRKTNKESKFKTGTLLWDLLFMLHYVLWSH